MLKKIFFIIVAFCGWAFCGQANDVEVDYVKTAFTEPEDLQEFDDDYYTKKFFDDKFLDMKQRGVYVLLTRWKKKEGFGDFFGFISENSLSMKSYFLLRGQCYDDSYDCLDCLVEVMHWDTTSLYNKCIKDIPITEEFYRLVKRFFDEKKKSLKDLADNFYFSKKGNPCYYNLSMFYQDEKGNRQHFNMLPSECIDPEMRKNPVIDDYVKLYDTFTSLFMPSFPNCRWDGYIDRERIVKHCKKHDFDMKREWVKKKKGKNRRSL